MDRRSGLACERWRAGRPGHPEVVVIGDAAVAGGGGTSWAGVAPVAMQQGAHVGRFVAARLEGRPAPRFRYRNKGNLATIGTGAAVVELGRLRFGGRLAWVLWLFVHIDYFVLFQSRLLVLVSGHGTPRAAERPC